MTPTSSPPLFLPARPLSFRVIGLAPYLSYPLPNHSPVKATFLLTAVSCLLATVAGPVRADDEDLADVVAAVVKPRGTTILAGSAAIAEDDVIFKAGNTYITKDDVIIKSGCAYIGNRGTVIQSGDAFIGDRDTTIKAGDAYIGSRGATIEAGPALIGPDE
jgi:hypothetical protein